MKLTTNFLQKWVWTNPRKSVDGAVTAMEVTYQSANVRLQWHTLLAVIIIDLLSDYLKTYPPFTRFINH